MRCLVLASLLLLAPSAWAAQTGLATDAPLILEGALRASAEKLTLFHLAYANGTLSGTVHNGTLWEDHRHQVQCQFPYAAPGGMPPTLETHAIRQIGPDRPLGVDLHIGGQVTAIFSDSNEQPLALPDRDAPGALLGPNPFLYVPWSGGYSSITDDAAAEAFPRTEFLLAPLGRLALSQPLAMELETGNLSVTQDNGTQLLRAASRTEETVSCSGPLGQTQPGSHVILRNYRLTVGTGVFTVLQNGATGLREYYHGTRGVANPYREDWVPPRGYWFRNQGETQQRLYDEFALPNTFLAGQTLSVGVEGVIRLRAATGSLGATEFQGEDGEVSGRMLVTPLSQTEDGRRMQSQVVGDVFLARLIRDSTSTDYKPYVAGAAAGVLLTGLLTYAWPGAKFRLAQLLLLPLYARLKKEDILENAIRDDILHVVGAQPGISASELGRRLECGWGTLVYHLTVLERMKLLSSAREGRHKRFFVQGRINYSDKGALAILANPAARIILDAVRRSPGIIQKDLGTLVGLSAGTVAWHVERLAANGLILKQEDGRSVRYLPSERLIELTRETAA